MKKSKKGSSDNMEGAVPFNLEEFEKKYGAIEVDEEEDEEDEGPHEHNAEGECMREPVVIKTFPLKASWLEAYNELKDAKNEALKLAKAAKNLMQKVNAKHRKFWALVETDTGIYREMRVNKEDSLIEVIK